MTPFLQIRSTITLICLAVCFAHTVCGQETASPGTDLAGSPPPSELSVESTSRRIRLLENQPFTAPKAESETDGSVFGKRARSKSGVCDVYLPKTPAQKKGYPVVIIVHGGGWISGDKWTVEGYGRLLADAGYAAIAINYRLAPTDKFPAPVDDLRQALVWTAKNAEKHSLDCSRLGLFGYSAGGHLSLLAGLLSERSYDVVKDTTEWPRNDDRWRQLPRVRAVCAGAPPCDFRDMPLDNTALAYFLGGSRRQCPVIYNAASPITHVHADAPPVQLIHGDKDALVQISNSKMMLDALEMVGVDTRLQTVPNRGHMLTFMSQTTSKTMLAFFDDVLKP